MTTGTVLVTGAGGFIGGHLVGRLLDEGHYVYAVDVKPLERWYQTFPEAYNHGLIDVANLENYVWMLDEVRDVYHLAADMGGIGFITANRVACWGSFVGSYTLLTRLERGQRAFFSSSACVYPAYRQDRELVAPLRESDAFPADAEPGYGWEKLMTELLLNDLMEERGVEVRVARYHNVYGPHGAWNDGREKAPAALCRKVAWAALTGERHIDVWGDGEQTRSFMYVDDCVEGTRRIVASDYPRPLNLGSDRLVTVNQLLDVIERVAGTQLNRVYVEDAPQGVRGRNSDNTLIQKVLGWTPEVPLEVGIERTYRWIYDRLAEEL